MAKQIVAVTGEYTKQDGTQGANFTEIGVIMVSQNGREYALLDPTINLAGVLLKQNAMAMARGEQLRDMVMCSVKERQHQSSQPANQAARQPQQNGYGAQQQARPSNQQTARPQQQNYSNQAPNRSAPAPQGDSFDDDIPFS